MARTEYELLTPAATAAEVTGGKRNEEAQGMYHAAVAKHLAEAGTKKDAGKDPWDLLPWEAVRGVVQILAFGANKYGRRNWEKGIAYGRVYAAAQRHLTAWWGGEDCDPETGFSHLAHASCCTLFLLAFVLRRRGELDDRPCKAVTP